MSQSFQPGVHAAGVVLWRGHAGVTEVAVVHRPHYDDWSLPKGKLDPGENAPIAAVRETAEETGYHAVLGRFLLRVEYRVPRGKVGGTEAKAVDYFAAAESGGEFSPNDEVDELRWLTPERAEQLLTHRSDVDVLRRFCAWPAELKTVLLVRHAKAGKRSEWNGDDDLRPLSEAGQRQAAVLHGTLELFGPDEVLAAPRLRCVQTVRAVADDLGVDVAHEPLLSEEGYWRDTDAGVARFLDIVGAAGTPVICSQGGVIPDILGALAERDGVQLSTVDGAVPSKKGSVWLLAFRSGPDGPSLADAAYFPAPAV